MEFGKDPKYPTASVSALQKLMLIKFDLIRTIAILHVGISCPVPGHFSRGQILGRSYLFGDKITYQCNEGYDLKGNVQRVCKSDGKWSGGTPICIGNLK